MLEKVQIVIFKLVQSELMVLLLQTNEARGGFWQNITGGVESFDETIQDAAIREVSEEVGIKITRDQLHSINYVFEYNNPKRGHHYREHCFFAIIDDSEQIDISALEHQAFKWERAIDISDESYFFTTNFEAFIKALQQVETN